jgi:hypothetical protein
VCSVIKLLARPIIWSPRGLSANNNNCNTSGALMANEENYIESRSYSFLPNLYIYIYHLGWYGPVDPSTRPASHSLIEPGAAPHGTRSRACATKKRVHTRAPKPWADSRPHACDRGASHLDRPALPPHASAPASVILENGRWNLKNDWAIL